jgi:chromosome segregation ATPase
MFKLLRDVPTSLRLIGRSVKSWFYTHFCIYAQLLDLTEQVAQTKVYISDVEDGVTDLSEGLRDVQSEFSDLEDYHFESLKSTVEDNEADLRALEDRVGSEAEQSNIEVKIEELQAEIDNLRQEIAQTEELITQPEDEKAEDETLPDIYVTHDSIMDIVNSILDEQLSNLEISRR